MEKEPKLEFLVELSRRYFDYLMKYSEKWNLTFRRTRDKERSLLKLSDQLRCLSGPNNGTNLTAAEIRWTLGRATLEMEEEFSDILASWESVLTEQDGLTSLRMSIEDECEPFKENNIVQQLMKLIYVSWLSWQLRSSTLDAALKTVDYKVPDTIVHLFQSITDVDLDELTRDLKVSDTMEKAENLISMLELSV